MDDYGQTVKASRRQELEGGGIGIGLFDSVLGREGFLGRMGLFGWCEKYFLSYTIARNGGSRGFAWTLRGLPSL